MFTAATAALLYLLCVINKSQMAGTEPLDEVVVVSE